MSLQFFVWTFDTLPICIIFWVAQVDMGFRSFGVGVDSKTSSWFRSFRIMPWWICLSFLCHSPSTARNDRSFNMNLMKLPKKTQSDWTETLTYDMLWPIWANMSSCELCWFLLRLVHLLDSYKFKIDWSHCYRLSPFNNFTFFVSLNLESRNHLNILNNILFVLIICNCASLCRDLLSAPKSFMAYQTACH